jgi:GT2 family glycosyltransferase
MGKNTIKSEENNISVIIPVHKLNGTEVELLKSAVESVAAQSQLPDAIIITTTAECKGLIEKTLKKSLPKSYKGLTIALADGDTSFPSMVNLGVTEVKTDYFTVLEFDDYLMTSFMETSVKYLNEYPEVSMFMPFIGNVDGEGSFVKYGNETLWAMDFTTELGFLDNDAIRKYPDYNLSGTLVKTEDFRDVNGMKPSIKYKSTYEFFLRFTAQEKIIKSIPKMTYIHTINREGSFLATMMDYKTRPSVEEFNYWFNAAETESEFTDERPLEIPSFGVKK